MAGRVPQSGWLLILLAGASVVLGQACGFGSDAKATPTQTSVPVSAADMPGLVRGALLGTGDLPTGWTIENSTDSAATIGCSGTPENVRFGAYRVSGVSGSQPLSFIQTVVVLQPGTAVQFMNSIPCKTDPTFQPLTLPDDPTRISAFQKKFEGASDYQVVMVFVRRGDVVSYFTLQQLATDDQTQLLARRVDNKLLPLDNAVTQLRP